MKASYIPKLFIALCLFVGTIGFVPGTSAASTGFSDQFDSSSLSSGWTWVDPSGDSSYSLTANPGHLRLYTPDSGHDLYLNLDAPRMVQTVSGDFTITTKVTIDSQYNYQGAGLLLWQAANNYIRIERTLVSGIDVWYRLNGTYGGSEKPYSASPTVYLRIQRMGDQLYTSYSEDNVNWIYVLNFGGFSFSESLQAGLVLVNEWQDNPIWADFDYFEVEGTTPSADKIDISINKTFIRPIQVVEGVNINNDDKIDLVLGKPTVVRVRPIISNDQASDADKNLFLSGYIPRRLRRDSITV